MAVKAFILIDTSPGKAREVAAKIRGVTGVSVAHAVTGPHDIIAICEASITSLTTKRPNLSAASRINCKPFSPRP